MADQQDDEGFHRSNTGWMYPKCPGGRPITPALSLWHTEESSVVTTAAASRAWRGRDLEEEAVCGAVFKVYLPCPPCPGLAATEGQGEKGGVLCPVGG